MNKRFEYTPEQLPSLEPNEVFIFGANKLGLHYGGAALFAQLNLGAVMGEIHRTGRCYGLVTLYSPSSITGKTEENKLTLEDLDEEFRLMFKQVELEKEKVFYLTKVGLGIAGFALEEILRPFNKWYCPGRHSNLVYPIEFENDFYKNVNYGLLTSRTSD